MVKVSAVSGLRLALPPEMTVPWPLTCWKVDEPTPKALHRFVTCAALAPVRKGLSKLQGLPRLGLSLKLVENSSLMLGMRVATWKEPRTVVPGITPQSPSAFQVQALPCRVLDCWVSRTPSVTETNSAQGRSF